MRYADTLLTQGEVIVVRARQHWLALFLDARSALALWIIGLLMLLAVVFFNPDQGIRNILSYIGLGAIAIGLLVFLYHFWRWWSQDYLVTNRRILKVEGVLNKHAADSSLEKINDAVLDQNIFGRMFNYGDLDILTAAETAIDKYRMLNRAPAFKREMLQQKYALETEFAYHAPPTPPLRAPEPQSRYEAMPPRQEAPPPRQEAPPPRQEAPPPRQEAPPPGPQWQQAPAAQAPMAGDGGTAAATAPAGAEGTGAPATGVPMGAVPPAPPPPASAAAESDAAAVTQTLSRLADLRDRGAITPEEYEAKKDELLGRL